LIAAAGQLPPKPVLVTADDRIERAPPSVTGKQFDADAAKREG
jgi:hypothetical protein